MLCPVCGGERDLYCGNSWILHKITDHYVIFPEELPKKLPKKGCPICGRPMEEAGKVKKRMNRHKEVALGESRMSCDKSGHLVIVTEKWYQANGREK